MILAEKATEHIYMNGDWKGIQKMRHKNFFSSFFLLFQVHEIVVNFKFSNILQLFNNCKKHIHSIQYTKYTVYFVFAKCTQSWFRTIYLRVTSLKLSFGQLWASLPITIPDVYYQCRLVHLMYTIFLFKGTEDFHLFLKNKNKAYRKSAVSVCSAPYQQKMF